MRALSLTFSALTLMMAISVTGVSSQARAHSGASIVRQAAVTDDVATGQHLDMSNRAMLRCSAGGMLLRTAYVPDRAPVSTGSCFSATERLGTGYARSLSTSVVRKPHHRLRV